MCSGILALQVACAVLQCSIGAPAVPGSYHPDSETT